MHNEDQSQRGTQLLEIYALEIQMHNEMRNVKKLKVGLIALVDILWLQAIRM